MTENLHIVEVTKLPPQLMVLFGCDHDAALSYAEKWGELVYYVESNDSYYVIAHNDHERATA